MGNTTRKMFGIYLTAKMWIAILLGIWLAGFAANHILYYTIDDTSNLRYWIGMLIGLLSFALGVVLTIKCFRKIEVQFTLSIALADIVGAIFVVAGVFQVLYALTTQGI